MLLKENIRPKAFQTTLKYLGDFSVFRHCHIRAGNEIRCRYLPEAASS